MFKGKREEAPIDRAPTMAPGIQELHEVGLAVIAGSRALTILAGSPRLDPCHGMISAAHTCIPHTWKMEAHGSEVHELCETSEVA